MRLGRGGWDWERPQSSPLPNWSGTAPSLETEKEQEEVAVEEEEDEEVEKEGMVGEKGEWRKRRRMW